MRGMVMQFCKRGDAWSNGAKCWNTMPTPVRARLAGRRRSGSGRPAAVCPIRWPSTRIVPRVTGVSARIDFRRVRALARAGAAEQRHHLAATDLQRQAFQHRLHAVSTWSPSMSRTTAAVLEEARGRREQVGARGLGPGAAIAAALGPAGAVIEAEPALQPPLPAGERRGHDHVDPARGDQHRDEQEVLRDDDLAPHRQLVDADDGGERGRRAGRPPRCRGSAGSPTAPGE